MYDMEGEVLAWLNQIHGGTMIAILIVFGGAFLSVLKVIRNAAEKHKTYVEAQTRKRIADQEFQNRMLDMVKQVEKMNSDIQKIKVQIDKESGNRDKEIKEIRKKITETSDRQKETESKLTKMSDNITLLIDSDKNKIKSFITSEYHKWMDLKYIDIYSLAGIEDQFDKYKKEHGNTFVEELVQELRKLPKRTSVENPDLDNIWKEKLNHEG